MLVKEIMLHISFTTGVLADKAGGNYQTETIYNDADADQIETIAPTQPHRNVDLELIDADKQGLMFHIAWTVRTAELPFYYRICQDLPCYPLNYIRACKK